MSALSDIHRHSGQKALSFDGPFLRWTSVGGAALLTVVCAASIEAVAHTAVLHRGEMLSEEAIGKLTDETTRLVVGYLR